VTPPTLTSASHRPRQTSIAATSMTKATGTSRSCHPIRTTSTATMMGSPVRVANWAYFCWGTDVRNHPPRVHGYIPEGVVLRLTPEEATREGFGLVTSFANTEPPTEERHGFGAFVQP
jgi:hypothetical protein